MAGVCSVTALASLIPRGVQTSRNPRAAACIVSSRAPMRPCVRFGGGLKRAGTRARANSINPPRPETAVLEDQAFCSAPYVEVENPPDGAASVLTIEVGDFPGLLRLIAWSLNGLDVRIVRAKLANKNGIAIDTFWITDLNGKQISDPHSLRDRLVDILTSCINAERDAQDVPVFTAGPVTVDNSKMVDGTCVILKANPNKNSELLEVASLLSGLNMNVEEAEMTCSEWRFKITRKGKKLDNTQAASLAFALLVATNKNAMIELPI